MSTFPKQEMDCAQWNMDVRRTSFTIFPNVLHRLPSLGEHRAPLEPHCPPASCRWPKKQKKCVKYKSKLNMTKCEPPVLLSSEFIFQSQQVRSRVRRRFFWMSARRTSSNASSPLLSLLTIYFGTSSTRFGFTFTYISMLVPSPTTLLSSLRSLLTSHQFEQLQKTGSPRRKIEWKFISFENLNFYCSLCPSGRTGRRSINCPKTSLQAPSQSAGPSPFLLFPEVKFWFQTSTITFSTCWR